MQYIKVNFPRNEESFKSGNGEGMWVLVDDEISKAYSLDAAGEVCFGTLDNDSVYYPALKAGERVVFELRGDNRPVALIKGFFENYKVISDEELETIMAEIMAENMLKTLKEVRRLI